MHKHEKQQISSGATVIDELLEGGYEKSIITTIYGPAGAGKTNLMLIALCNCIKNGGKAIYIDTEGSFSVERVLQIYPDFQARAKQVVFMRPYTFDEQKQAVLKLKETVDENPKEYQLIIIDSIAMLYRLESSKTLDPNFVNKELALQLGNLMEIARKHSVPVLVTNQVYADFDRKDMIKMVGGDLLKYTSKCLLELKKAHNGLRVATLIRHRSIAEGKEIAFRIVSTGVEKEVINPISDISEEQLL
ncbi:MAG TPA: DNA repair and recombination protein RadB [Acidobacteriota bacterium]|nr:DNA repair and recombination protein RadB [Acidobacteriota bacterium]